MIRTGDDVSSEFAVAGHSYSVRTKRICAAGERLTATEANRPLDSFTPVGLLARMRASGQECFLLESVEGGETTGRYTFLGCGPVARFEISQG